MGMWDPVTREHVLFAIAEYDDLGQLAFLERHGFGVARAYQLIVGGRSYDSKAVLGAAYRRATGQRITPHDFNGGIGYNGAATVLRRLGFHVVQTRSTEVRRTPRTASPTNKSTGYRRPLDVGDVLLIGCVKTKQSTASRAGPLHIPALRVSADATRRQAASPGSY